MPKRRNAHCRVCGGHRSQVGTISARGKCGACGEAFYIGNHRAMKTHAGPFFDHWRARTLAAFGVFVDEPPATE